MNERIKRLDLALAARGLANDSQTSNTTSFINDVSGISTPVYRSMREERNSNLTTTARGHWTRLASSLHVPAEWLIDGNEALGFHSPSDMEAIAAISDLTARIADEWNAAMTNKKEDTYTSGIEKWIEQHAKQRYRGLLDGFHRSITACGKPPTLSRLQMAALAEAWKIEGAPEALHEELQAHLHVKISGDTAKNGLNLGRKLSFARPTIYGLHESDLVVPDETHDPSLSLDRANRILSDNNSYHQLQPFTYAWSRYAKTTTECQDRQLWYRACQSIDLELRENRDADNSDRGKAIAIEYAIAAHDAYCSIFTDDRPLTLADAIRCRRLFNKLFIAQTVYQMNDHLQKRDALITWKPGTVHHLDSVIKELRALDTTQACNAMRSRVKNQAIPYHDDAAINRAALNRDARYLALDRDNKWFSLNPHLGRHIDGNEHGLWPFR